MSIIEAVQAPDSTADDSRRGPQLDLLAAQRWMVAAKSPGATAHLEESIGQLLELMEKQKTFEVQMAGGTEEDSSKIRAQWMWMKSIWGLLYLILCSALLTSLHAANCARNSMMDWQSETGSRSHPCQGVGSCASKAATFHVFSKNARGLKSDEDIMTLLDELDDVPWDAVLLSETWRAAQSEKWTTADGNLFAGSGGMNGSRGVAILLRAKWVADERSFQAINERICCVDVECGDCQLRVMSVYLPHAGYGDAAAEQC